MKRRMLFSAGAAILCLLLTMSAVSGEINFLSTDGYWGYIDDGYDGVRIDVVGVIGSDPGTAWTGSGEGAGNSTQDYRLIRNAGVCTHDPDGDATLSEWTGTPGSGSVYSTLGSHTFTPVDCDYQGLFISEYIEGAARQGPPWGEYPDAIEIYNNAGFDINFGTRPYYLQIYADGSQRATTTITLTGTLLKNQTYVVASANITGVTEHLVTNSLNFNGDDAVAIVRGYMADTAEDDGADGQIWATGPTTESPTGDTPGATSTTNPAIQFPPDNDWNQVRYGTQSSFGNKSGLAFHGVTRTEGAGEYGDQEPFLVGKFCHVNNPINATNLLKSCPLTLDLFDVSCGEDAVAPFPPPRLTFVYPVFLDETSNEGDVEDCTYESDTVCADAVTFGLADSNFRCYYGGDVVNEYTVAIIGFWPLASADTACPTAIPEPEDPEDPDELTGIFISQEGTTNCGCMFAMITESEVTAVDLIDFSAVGGADGIKVSWQTATETENLGFNLYRAESLGGTRVLLNDGLIPTGVPSGSPFGAEYEFQDATAVSSVTYFYWLEDVDLAGAATLHGPVSATMP